MDWGSDTEQPLSAVPLRTTGAKRDHASSTFELEVRSLQSVRRAWDVSLGEETFKSKGESVRERKGEESTHEEDPEQKMGNGEISPRERTE